jgi:hypothetical protein
MAGAGRDERFRENLIPAPVSEGLATPLSEAPLGVLGVLVVIFPSL